VKSQTPGPRADAQETVCLQARCGPWPCPTFFLPCRRSRVRIPSAAFERSAFAGLFCMRSRLERLRRVGLTPDSPRPDRRPFQRTPPVCRPILVRPNPSPSAGLQKVGCSPAAAVTPTRTAAARSGGQRPPARYERSRHLGASPVSVRKPGGQPRPAPRQPASHGTAVDSGSASALREKELLGGGILSS
jgi:hypothetical protein